MGTIDAGSGPDLTVPIVLNQTLYTFRFKHTVIIGTGFLNFSRASLHVWTCKHHWAGDGPGQIKRQLRTELKQMGKEELSVYGYSYLAGCILINRWASS